jgi:transposase
MSQIVTIGLDIAKSVFQLHGVDAVGEMAFAKSLAWWRNLQFEPAQAVFRLGCARR